MLYKGAGAESPLMDVARPYRMSSAHPVGPALQVGHYWLSGMNTFTRVRQEERKDA